MKRLLILACAALALTSLPGDLCLAERAKLIQQGWHWVSGRIDEVKRTPEATYLVVDGREYKIASRDVTIRRIVGRDGAFQVEEADLYYLSSGKRVSLLVQRNIVREVEINP